MALLKNGTRYPIVVVSSLSYKCKKCNLERTIITEDCDKCLCPNCGCEMQLLASHTEIEPSGK